jgi:hypothetical protein
MHSRAKRDKFGDIKAALDRAWRVRGEANQAAKRARSMTGNPRPTTSAGARLKALREAAARRNRRWASLPGKVRALHEAIDRAERTTRTSNPRKATSTMAKKMKRNRLGRFVKRARGTLGRLVAGTPRKRRKKSRASRSRRRLQPTQGVTMSRALVANPRKRRKRASSRRRTSSGRFIAKRRTARNPRKRRHHGRHRRNPGMAGGFIKAAIGSLMPMGVGGIGGAVCGMADAKFMSDKPVVSALSKLVLGAAGAGLLRKRPALAFGWAGGVVGSFGYSMGVKAMGGLVAHSPATALKGIADMAADNPEMAALLEGLGDVGPDDGVGDVGDSDEYVAALSGADGDGDGVGELVDAD